MKLLFSFWSLFDVPPKRSQKTLENHTKHQHNKNKMLGIRGLSCGLRLATGKRFASKALVYDKFGAPLNVLRFFFDFILFYFVFFCCVLFLWGEISG